MTTDDEARRLYGALQAGEEGGLLGMLARRGQARSAAFTWATAELEADWPEVEARLRDTLDGLQAHDARLAAEDRRAGGRVGAGVRLAVEPVATGWRVTVLEAPEGASLWWGGAALPLDLGATLHLEGDEPWLFLDEDGAEHPLRPG